MPASSRISRATVSSSVSPTSTKPASVEKNGSGKRALRASSARPSRSTSMMTAGESADRRRGRSACTCAAARSSSARSARRSARRSGGRGPTRSGRARAPRSRSRRRRARRRAGAAAPAPSPAGARVAVAEVAREAGAPSSSPRNDVRRRRRALGNARRATVAAHHAQRLPLTTYQRPCGARRADSGRERHRATSSARRAPA